MNWLLCDESACVQASFDNIQPLSCIWNGKYDAQLWYSLKEMNWLLCDESAHVQASFDNIQLLSYVRNGKYDAQFW